MAEKEPESGQTQGSEGTTTPPASQGAGVQQSSTTDATQLVDQVLARLDTSLDERIQRAVQSTKDKRFNEQEQFRRDYQPILDKIKGLVPAEDFDKLQRDLEMEDLRSVVTNLVKSGQQVTGNNSPTPPVDMAKLIGDSGLDRKDPQVVMNLLGKTYGSELEAKAAIADYLIAKNKAPSPTPSQSPADNTGEPPGSVTEEGLMSDYRKEVAKYRGNIMAVTQIQQKYLKKAQEAGLVLNL